MDVTSARLPPEIEASAYFFVAEALTNVVKHAQATRAEVTATVDDDTLRLEVRDDGIGGADPEGHGLLGVSDRVAALGGRLRDRQPARRRHRPGRGRCRCRPRPRFGLLRADRRSTTVGSCVDVDAHHVIGRRSLAREVRRAMCRPQAGAGHAS